MAKKGKLLILSILLVSLFFCNCSRTPQYIKYEGNALGTYYAITFWDENTSLMVSQVEIVAEIEYLNQNVSIFDPNSLVSKINRNETDSLSPLLEELLAESLLFSELTDGAFDCTIGALVNLWGFGIDTTKKLTDEVVQQALASVGYEKIKIENHKIIKEDSVTQLNFNAVAKGLCVDRVAQLLSSKGVENYIVDIGGELVVKGEKALGKPWRIGVQKPTETADGPEISQHIIDVKDEGVATSGNYRNYIEKDGVRYAHTINPKTGYPEKSTLLSATVIAKDCQMADALATAFMVMGADKAREFQKNNPEIEIYLIESDDL